MKKDIKISLVIGVVIILALFGLYKLPLSRVAGGFYSQSATGGPSGHMVMNTATTTVCAIQSPNATTTVPSFTADFTVSSTTAMTLTMATALNAFSTTTLLNTFTLAANAQVTIVASSTPMTGKVYGPNTWFVVSIAGGNGNFSPTGTCNISFTTVN